MRQRDPIAGDKWARVVAAATDGRGRKGQGRGWLGLHLGLALLGLGGCDLGMDPDSLVRELRILAMRVTTGDPAAVPTVAELQAQVVLGAGGLDLVFTTAQVTLSALVAAPTGPGRRLPAARPLQYDWFLCVGARSLYSPGTLDPGCQLWGPSDPDPKTNSSLVYLNGFDPLAASSPMLTLPTDTLKGLLTPFLQIALSASKNAQGKMTGDPACDMRLKQAPQVVLLPVLLRTSVVGGDPADNRNSEVGYNYLRVVIAVPALGIMLPPANQNPVLAPVLGSLQRDGVMQPLQPCSVDGSSCPPYGVPRSAATFLTGRAADGSIQTYDPIDDSCRQNIAETMRFSWFSSDGEFTQLRTGTMQPQTQWSDGVKYPAPAEVSTVQVWLVLQDERGGTDWQQYNLQLQ